MWRRRVLLLLKPFDVYPPRSTGTVSPPLPGVKNPQILRYLDDRCRVHKETINYCQDVLQRKSLDLEPVFRNDLSQPIRHVDLVVTVGGDGTLLQASHFMDDSIPIVGVNSDPTQVEEVKEFSNEYDATRSTGYLCAATAANFEQLKLNTQRVYEAHLEVPGNWDWYGFSLRPICFAFGLPQETGALVSHFSCFKLQVLDEILEGHKAPSKLSRISICLNGHPLSTYALNDILVAHPCPATVSRFSFLITGDGQKSSSLVNSRSSGLRVSTAAGSTAAMLSAGGFPMPVSSKDLQYMVREPILPRADEVPLLHGIIRADQTMDATWFSKEGILYIDGSHIFHSLRHGDSIEISSRAPILKVFLPPHLLT